MGKVEYCPKYIKKCHASIPKKSKRPSTVGVYKPEPIRVASTLIMARIEDASIPKTAFERYVPDVV